MYRNEMCEKSLTKSKTPRGRVTLRINVKKQNKNKIKALGGQVNSNNANVTTIFY